jgi:hypothetical protein
MLDTHWIVRAIKPAQGWNAIGGETLLAPGQRGWMLRIDAVNGALAGDVEMLSPGGLEAVHQKAAARASTARPAAPPAPPAPVAEAPAPHAAPAPAPMPPPLPTPSVAPPPPALGPQARGRRQ